MAPVLAWLPVESTIRQRRSGYYAALAKSDAAGSSELSVEFMLEAIRDSLLPFAKPDDARGAALSSAAAFFEENPQGSVAELAAHLGVSKRSAERVVAELKAAGKLERKGSPRTGCWVVLDVGE